MDFDTNLQAFLTREGMHSLVDLNTDMTIGNHAFQLAEFDDVSGMMLKGILVCSFRSMRVFKQKSFMSMVQNLAPLVDTELLNSSLVICRSAVLVDTSSR